MRMFSFLVMDEKIMTTLKKVTLWALFLDEKFFEVSDRY